MSTRDDRTNASRSQQQSGEPEVLGHEPVPATGAGNPGPGENRIGAGGGNTVGAGRGSAELGNMGGADAARGNVAGSEAGLGGGRGDLGGGGGMGDDLADLPEAAGGDAASDHAGDATDPHLRRGPTREQS